MPKTIYVDADTGKMVIIQPHIGDCLDSQCAECEHQFRQTEAQLNVNLKYIEPGLSLRDAEKMMQGYATSIAADLGYLKAKIAAHGNTIINKWRKKSHQKRYDDVKRAHPSMFDQSQFLVWARHELIDWVKGREYHDSYLLPYLSTESFVKDPYKLFALLHARTKYSPEDWVSFDKNQTNLGWCEGRLAVHYSDCSIALQGTHYGHIVPWQTSQAHRWDICAFPRAKIILEAQFVLMRFLRRLVAGLVHGLQDESNALRWIQLADTGFRGAIGSESWSTFTNKALSDPTFSFDRLLDIAKSKYAEATDHLWLLQTDATYLLHHVKTVVQARVCDSTDKKSKQSAKYMIVPSFTWVDPLLEAQSWAWIVEEVEYVKSVYEKFRDNIYPGQPLPPKFDFAMSCLELLLVNQAQNRRKALGGLISRSAGFQDWFQYSPMINGKVIIKLHPSAVGKFQVCYYKDPLFWCLWSLYNNFETDDLANPAIQFNFLDNLLAKETSESKSRLDRRLLGALSSLIANHGILAAVRHFRPMYCNARIDDARAKCKDRAAWRCMVALSDLPHQPSPQSMIENLGKIFRKLESSTFPSGVRDSVWLQRANDVRKASADFWAKAREMQKCLLNYPSMSMLNEDDKRRSLEWLSYDCTPEHLNALQKERDAILAPKAQRELSNYNVEGSALQWTSKTAIEKPSAPVAPQVKTKVKSRPEPIMGESCTLDNMQQDFSSILTTDSNTDQSSLARQILVKAETIRVLSRLFPNSVKEYAAKPLEWHSFVVAMEDAGFLATNSGGSAVAFVKEGEGRIVLHKPHPVAKIEKLWLQSWGKRMNKWFSWSRETFINEKDAKAANA